VNNNFNLPILVTGAAGLIGGSVVYELLTSGKQVIGLDICPQNIDSDNLHWIVADMVDPNLEVKLNEYDVGTVVHCAAHPGGKSLEEPSIDVQINCYASMRLFEMCAKRNIDIIYLSSSVIYGDSHRSYIKEDVPLFPGTIYGVCKVACENFLRVLQEGYQLKWTVLRIFATYGAGHQPNLYQGIVNVMLTQMQLGNKVVVKGSLDRARDMVYVKDVADAIVKSIYSPKSRSCVINIGTGKPVTIHNLINTLAYIMGRSLDDFDIIEESGTVGDPFYCSADISVAKELLGFKPEYTLEQGLIEMLKSKTILND